VYLQRRVCSYRSHKRQEFFADYLAQYNSHFTLTQAALADGGEGPANVS
jgi:hypothetical protein